MRRSEQKFKAVLPTEGWTLRRGWGWGGRFAGANPSRCEVVTAAFDRTPTRRRIERLERGREKKKKSPDVPGAVFANATLPVALSPPRCQREFARVLLLLPSVGVRWQEEEASMTVSFS